MDIRNTRYWDPELEGGLPDCRLRHGARKTVNIGRLTYSEVYCANCGKLWGRATEQVTHVFHICDGCVEKYGPPGNLKEVPPPARV